MGNSRQEHHTHIVIAGWNHCEMTFRCLQSVIDNTPPDDYTITYVDNGSQRLLADTWIRDPFPQINYVTLPRNTGYCHANNIGMAMALLDDSDTILLLNNDAEIRKDDLAWLENMRKGLDPSKVGAVGAVSNNVAGNQRRASMGAGYSGTSVLIGFCLLLRKSAVIEVGLLDERFDPDGNYSDFDYSKRLTDAGWKLIIAENVFVQHAAHTTQKDLNFSANLKTNERRYQEKYHLAASV